MTKDQLIQKLQSIPGDAEVFFWDKEQEMFTEINKVFVDSDGDISLSLK